MVAEAGRMPRRSPIRHEEADVGVYVPHRGKLIVFTRGTDPSTVAGLPEGPGAIRLEEYPLPAHIVPREFDTAPFARQSAVREIRDVWYSLPYDNLGAAMDPNPQLDPTEEPLADLASCYWPMRVLLDLERKGTDAVRPLVRAVLDGDQAALAILADALEESGHRSALAVRSLVDGDPPALPPRPPRKPRKP